MYLARLERLAGIPTYLPNLSAEPNGYMTAPPRGVTGNHSPSRTSGLSLSATMLKTHDHDDT
jgi:hypothetical protein